MGECMRESVHERVSEWGAGGAGGGPRLQPGLEVLMGVGVVGLRVSASEWGYGNKVFPLKS